MNAGYDAIGTHYSLLPHHRAAENGGYSKRLGSNWQSLSQFALPYVPSL